MQKACLICSQISTGEENGLRIRVYGDKGGLEWYQEEPNVLTFRPLEGPAQIFKPGNPYLCEAAQRASRIPPGHPEAFLEAFANVYKNATATMRAKKEGREPDEFERDFPTVYEGARGVHFIEKTVESAQSEEKWTDARYSREEVPLNGASRFRVRYRYQRRAGGGGGRKRETRCGGDKGVSRC